ncbi:hypothetical protein OC842_006805, partial [Tilletia horrida]
STSTAAPITSTVKVVSSSLVPATRTVVGTKVVTVPATKTVLLPQTQTSSTTTSSTTTSSTAATSTTTTTSTTTSTTTTSSTTATSDSATTSTTTTLSTTTIITDLPTTTSTTTTTSATSKTDTTTTTTTSTTTTVTATPTTLAPVRGFIRVVDVSNSNTLGYLNVVASSQGQAGSVAGSEFADIFELSGSTFALGGSGLNLRIVGDTSSFPYMGGVQLGNSGNGDLAVGSSNYVTLTTVAEVAPNSREDASSGYGTGVTESAIWNYDPVAQRFSATWTNSDGVGVTMPTVLALAVASYTYLTADETAFKQTYGGFISSALIFEPQV